jgi:hypothetical protein
MTSLHSTTSVSNGTEQAAMAIVELINAQPRSPRPDEIVAIINSLVRSTAAAASCPQCTALDREYGPITHCP